MSCRNQTWVLLLLCASVMMALPASSRPESLRWLGTLGGSQSLAYDVSSDGSAVVGRSLTTLGAWHAFLWTPGGGMQDLGTFGGSQSSAQGISSDGSVVVGWAQNAVPNRRAFRWTATGGMQELGTLGGSLSEAYDVSADGSVIVGGSWDALGNRRAFLWTSGGGMQDLGTLGGSEGWALGVSPNGAFVVGWAYNTTGNWLAFRWTAGGGMLNLGRLGASNSEAYAVSADGSVVVGGSWNPSARWRAFRWTQEGGMQELGTLGGRWSEAQDVSSDGSIVVGYAHDPGNFERAFRWTVASGMQNLNTLYAHLVGSGSWLSVASAISPNGRYIVGSGFNAQTGRTEVFLLDTWETFLPQNFSLLRGFVRSGGLSELFQSDNQYLRLIPGFVLNQAEAPIQIVVQGTAPVTQPLQVTLVWEVAGNVPNVEERVELYNFSTGQWDLVSQQVITQQDSRHEVSLLSPAYVSSTGEVRAKLSYRALGLVLFYPWEVRLDETSFAVIR